MTACAEVRHDLGVYALGALRDGDEARVREHLAACSPCRDEHGRLAGLRPLLDLAEPGFERAPGEEPSPLLEDAVLAGFRGRATRSARRRREWSSGVVVPSAAAGALLAVAALAAAGGLG